jgi:hypothetical protein
MLLPNPAQCSIRVILVARKPELPTLAEDVKNLSSFMSVTVQILVSPSVKTYLSGYVSEIRVPGFAAVGIDIKLKE